MSHPSVPPAHTSLERRITFFCVLVSKILANKCVGMGGSGPRGDRHRDMRYAPTGGPELRWRLHHESLGLAISHFRDHFDRHSFPPRKIVGSHLFTIREMPNGDVMGFLVSEQGREGLEKASSVHRVNEQGNVDHSDDPQHVVAIWPQLDEPKTWGDSVLRGTNSWIRHFTTVEHPIHIGHHRE